MTFSRMYMYIYIYTHIHVKAWRAKVRPGGLSGNAMAIYVRPFSYFRSGTGATAGLHNKIPAQKILAGGWVAQEPICSQVVAKIFQGLGPQSLESSNGDRVYLIMRLFYMNIRNPLCQYDHVLYCLLPALVWLGSDRGLLNCPRCPCCRQLPEQNTRGNVLYGRLPT